MSVLGKELLLLARHSIASHFEREKEISFSHPRLKELSASFVTLTIDGELRGCIGSVQAWRSLEEDVKANASMAAFSDPRFSALTKEELPVVCIEVSLLDTPKVISGCSEKDILDQLCPGKDGLILTYGQQRATFLPQVWEILPSPEAFLNQLKIKARLPERFWDETIKLERYGVEKWSEK